MASTRSAIPIQPQLVRIGLREYPIYGNDEHGWSIDERDFSARQSATWTFRYRSLDELVFALVNFHVSGERGAEQGS
jgi:hypothetical protein